jgi:nicotinate-nucleotide adenylyltransferase
LIPLSEAGQRIGVYGGTFDPLHNGHFQVAKAILQAFALDELLFVPAFVPPHKRKQWISSPFHRLAMLALATANEPQMFVSAIELEAPARPYTIETLQRLQAERPQAQLFFVMGADSFRDVTMWRDHERLLNDFSTIVATRPGYLEEAENIAAHLAPELQRRIVDLRGGRYPADTDLTAPQVYLTDYIEVDVAATSIRERAAQGEAVDDFTLPAVSAYIAKYRLYQNY